MNEKRIPIKNEELKHKKKSKSKGQPRSKHKHEYKTVLLHSIVEHPFNKKETIEHLSANKVCTICGRIDDIDPEQYVKIPIEHEFLNMYKREIKDPDSLEDWYCKGYLAKVAYKKDD